MADEFGLIQRLCRQLPIPVGAGIDHGVDLGPGDDAALVTVPKGQQLVVTTDTLNTDVHFFADADPGAVGYKSLAVNLSDLAAMGATPRWVTLNLSLPKSDLDISPWIDGFAEGFAELAKQYQVALIGGDLTSGPLAITVTAMGLVPKGKAVTRSGANAREGVWVTGTLGDAAAALYLYRQQEAVPEALQQRLMRPQARVDIGKNLLGIASSMIDVSDGLLSDLGHITQASECGARIDSGLLPLSETVLRHPEFDLHWPLAGGDDYELCFTAPKKHKKKIAALAKKSDARITQIGEVVAGQGITCLDINGEELSLDQTGWKHFE